MVRGPVQAVASATVQGRVRCVLAAEDAKVRGRLDRATGEIEGLEAPCERIRNFIQ